MIDHLADRRVGGKVVGSRGGVRDFAVEVLPLEALREPHREDSDIAGPESRHGVKCSRGLGFVARAEEDDRFLPIVRGNL